MTKIILLHGMWGTGKTLRPVADYFSSKGCDVFAPTLPDHQAGEPASEKIATYSVRDYVEYLLDRVELDQETIIVGHSMGGLLAQFLAAASPQPKGLILLASAGPKGTNCFHIPSAISMSHANFRWRFWAKAHKPGWRLARYALWNLVPESKARTLFDQLTYESGRAFAEIVYWMFDRNNSIDLDLNRIQMPTLLLGGEKDHIMVPSITRRLARRFPNHELFLLKDHAHWLFDEPGNEKVYGLIDQWLAKHRLLDSPDSGDRSNASAEILPLATSTMPANASTSVH